MHALTYKTPPTDSTKKESGNKYSLQNILLKSRKTTSDTMRRNLLTHVKINRNRKTKQHSENTDTRRRWTSQNDRRHLLRPQNKSNLQIHYEYIAI